MHEWWREGMILVPGARSSAGMYIRGSDQKVVTEQ